MPTTLTYSSLLADLRVYAERAFNAASDPLVYAQLPRLVNLAERRCATELKVQGFLKNVVDVFQVGMDVYQKPDRWREWVSINMGTGEVFHTVRAATVSGFTTLTLTRPHNLTVDTPVVVGGMTVSNYNGAFTPTNVGQLTVEYFTGAPDAAAADTGGVVAIRALEKRTPILPRSYEYLRGYWPDPRAVGVPLFYGDYDYYHFIVAPVPQLPYPFELNYYELPPLLDETNQTNWLTDIAPNLLLYAALLEMAPFLKNAEMGQTWQSSYERVGQSLTGQDLDKINDRTSERTKP